MRKFYCNGKKGYCDCDFLCEDCKYCDDTGGTEVEEGTNFDRIKGMSIEEMARFFATDRLPDFPHLPCYICEYNGDYGCKKDDECSIEYETEVYRKWLESEVEE